MPQGNTGSYVEIPNPYWQPNTGGRYYNNLPNNPIRVPVKPATPTPAPAAAASTPAKAATPAAPDTRHRDYINAAVARGGTYLTQALKDAGLSPADAAAVSARFNTALGGVGGNIKSDVVDPTAINNYYNYSDLFSKALTGETSAQKNVASAAFRGATPYGWEKTKIADTMDDPILNEINTQQQNELTTGLQRQLARGQISQGAYDYAMNQIANLSAGAMSTLQGIGGGVLSNYRTGLTNEASNYGNRLTNFQLGDRLNIADYNKTINDLVAADTGSLRGDIMKAIGGTKLYDESALVSKAGSVVGPSNAPVGGSTAQGTGFLTTDEEQRGTGTSGVF